MDKKRFQEIVEAYKTDPNSIQGLSVDEKKAFQQALVDEGYELPTYGVDGFIETETLGTLDKYIQDQDAAQGATTTTTTTDSVETTPAATPATMGSPTETPLQRKLRESAAARKQYAEEKGAADEFQRDKAFAQKDAYNVAQLGTDAARLASAIGQIKAGQRQRQEAVRPQMPLREVSPELQRSYQQALEKTGQGFTDAERAAMAQEDLYKFSNIANRLSGQGQASNTATNLQNLYGQSLKGNLSRTVADAQARQANEAYATQAGGALARDKDSLYKAQLQYGYVPALQDFRRKMGEAGITERQGRMNLDNLISLTPYRAANFVGDYYGVGVQRGRETPLERKRRKEGFYNSQINKNVPNPYVDPNEPIYDLPEYNPYNPALDGPVDPNEYVV